MVYELIAWLPIRLFQKGKINWEDCVKTVAAFILLKRHFPPFWQGFYLQFIVPVFIEFTALNLTFYQFHHVLHFPVIMSWRI